MGVAWIDVSGYVMREMLHLPTDCNIIASGEGRPGVVRMLVEHDSIPSDATKAIGTYRIIHGVTVFDRFYVAERSSELAVDREQ